MQLDSLSTDVVVGLILGSLSGASLIVVYQAARACASKWKWWIIALAVAFVGASMSLTSAALWVTEGRAAPALSSSWIGSALCVLAALLPTLKLRTKRRAHVRLDLGYLMFLDLYGAAPLAALLLLFWETARATSHPLVGFIVLQLFFGGLIGGITVGHFSWLVLSQRFYDSDDVRGGITRAKLFQRKSFRLFECLEAYDRSVEAEHRRTDPAAPGSHADE